MNLWLDGESTTSEDGVILLLGIEGRIQADKIDAFIREIVHYVETVTVVEGVGCEMDIHKVSHRLVKINQIKVIAFKDGSVLGVHFFYLFRQIDDFLVLGDNKLCPNIPSTAKIDMFI